MSGSATAAANGSISAQQQDGDGDDVQMAIAALSSMKAMSNGSGSKGRPAAGSMTLPPLSSMLEQQQHTASARGGVLQFSYVPAGHGGAGEVAGAAAGMGNTSSTSTSALTHSTATTPSVRTATSVSSPGTPPFEREMSSSRTPNGNGHLDDGAENGDEGFIGRVSQFPLVSGTLKLYERGRNSSRVVKAGLSLHTR